MTAQVYARCVRRTAIVCCASIKSVRRRFTLCNFFRERSNGQPSGMAVVAKWHKTDGFVALAAAPRPRCALRPRRASPRPPTRRVAPLPLVSLVAGAHPRAPKTTTNSSSNPPPHLFFLSVDATHGAFAVLLSTTNRTETRSARRARGAQTGPAMCSVDRHT